MIIRRIRPTPLAARRLIVSHTTRRSLIPAPKANSPPLLERRADRELPPAIAPNMLLRTLPYFLLIMAVSAAGLFNYQKQSTSVVSSTMYALRVHPEAREALGDEIGFASMFPWIWGTINQLQGKIDIEFAVKGNKAKGRMKFKSTRKSRLGFFETDEWTLEMKDGRVLQLLQRVEDDPFQAQE